MDQQKILRILRLLVQLSGTRFCSRDEIMETLDCSERTVYRYLETFDKAGFVLDRRDDKYRLLKKNNNTKSLQSLLHFSEEEVFVLYETLNLIDGTTSVKEQLLRKLNVLYDFRTLEQLQLTDDHTKIQEISEAIREKKQVLLKSYRSSNSNKITDRKVEPFDFLSDYRAVWCYELESKTCKQFKLARICEVERLDQDWENEQQHQVPFTDAFRIAAPKPIDEVVAILSLKAYNLLIEEYPLSRNFIEQEAQQYLLTIPVAGFNGIGRFVLGLPGEITVKTPKAFIIFLQKEQKKYALTVIDSGEK